MSIYQKGDLVCLRSGGPPMTVKSIYFDGNTVECVYFDDMMGFHTLQVPNHCVEMVPAIDPTVVPVKVPKVPKENERKK